MHPVEITTVEMHTGGEPVRIVTGGYPPIPGETILVKRRYVRERLDHLRRFLMYEPRGHFDMYGVIPVEPDLAEADLAVLFMHNEGYSTMCGHAAIALGRYAVDRGPEERTTQAPEKGRREGVHLACLSCQGMPAVDDASYGTCCIVPNAASSIAQGTPRRKVPQSLIKNVTEASRFPQLIMLLEQPTLAWDAYLAQGESCGYMDNSALRLSCPHIHKPYGSKIPRE